jgi:predicted  nucleic acid-binding Zn-ribbon protein
MATEVEQQYLLKKIDSIETRLEGHVTKIEQRLDQIVHLMQAVAQLQEKESRNAESIKDVKLTLKESVDKFDRTISRIHDRLDKIDSDNEKERSDFTGSSVELGKEIKSVEVKVDKWMNRGIGLWIGISALVIVLQTIGGLVLTSFKDDYSSVKTQQNELSKRQNELEQDIGRVGNNVRQLMDKR